MDSVDQTAKLIKQQADQVESIAVEHITTLCSERRKARKLYQEEQTWLNNQFQQVRYQMLIDTTQTLYVVLFE